MKRIVLFLSIVVLLLTLGVSSGVGDPIKDALQARGKAIEKFNPSLEAKIRGQGKARVMVHLQSPEEPFAQLVGGKGSSGEKFGTSWPGPSVVRPSNGCRTGWKGLSGLAFTCVSNIFPTWPWKWTSQS